MPQPISNSEFEFRAALARPAKVPNLHLDIKDDADAARAMQASRYTLRSDNTARLRVSTEEFFDIGLRTMGAGSGTYAGQGAELAVSGIIDVLLPLMRTTSVGQLGTPFQSVKFGEDSEFASYDTTVTAQLVDEDGSATPVDIATSSRKPKVCTGATPPIPYTRRLEKQASGTPISVAIPPILRSAQSTLMQSMLLTGTNTGLEPLGLETAVTTHALTGGVTPGNVATATRLLLQSGVNLAGLGLMLADDLFETLLSTPVETGTNTRMLRRSNSPTGYSLVLGNDDAGIPAGADQSMTAGTAILGDYSQARVLVNSEIDVTILKQGKPNGGAEVFSFVDFATIIDREAAFVKITPV